MSLDLASRIRNVTAVLGPTNTGKTHLAIERMLGHDTGMIGLPLRLLAREVYDKIAKRIGVDKVALITGEEKIKPDNPRYYVCTVEAMPRDVTVDFLAIDEVQLAADPERGHVFTDRLLHARGRQETLMLGAQTMREAINDLIPGANFISRPRLSKLTYAGEKKITRLPPRSAVVAFSASEVYAIAELIRRQRGGAAVVLGALSPRTRNAQVALYQSGDVDFLVATDAVGMGLNLDVDHVAFAGVRKFDGQVHRQLTPGELGQIAGRAGRHMNDGTFGVTGGVEALEPDLIERLETHNFDTVKFLQWRSRELDFATLDALRDSLRVVPREMRLTRARMADDVTALETVCHDREVTELATNREAVGRLWDVCQIPDYRKISTQNHAELAGTLFKFLMTGDRHIPADWFEKQVAFADRTDGDIDTLSNRIAHIRTWTFVSNRADWLADPAHWQERTRAIEDALSDALHNRLTQRFVDRRTSALMRGLKEKDEMYAEIGEDGRVEVEKHFVGRLKGFRFFPDTEGEGIHGKATRHAASHVVGKELAMRVRRVVAAKPDALKLTRRGAIVWREEEIGRLEPSEDPLKPTVVVICDEYLPAPEKEKVQEKLNAWITEIIGERLKPMVEIAAAPDVSGLGRGIAFRLKESFGALPRESVAEEVRSLDQPARAQLRKYGVRFGAFNIYFPMLLKPASADLAATLWLLRHGAAHGFDVAAGTIPEPPRAGLTSVIVDPAVPEAFYRVAGFHVCGPRAVRMDMLERLADLIRPLMAWRKKPQRAPQGAQLAAPLAAPLAEGAPQDAQLAEGATAEPAALPPKGATGDGGFTAIPEMMSILGCSAGELGNVFKALGFWADRRPMPAGANGKAAAAARADAPAASPAADAQTTAAPTVEAEGAAASAAEAKPDAIEAAASPPVEAVGEAAVEPAQDAVATVVTAPGAPATADAAAAPEEKWQEVWRPRRRGRTFERPQQEAKPGETRRPPREPRPDQREKRPHGGKPFRRHAGQGPGAGPFSGPSPGPSQGQTEPQGPGAGKAAGATGGGWKARPPRPDRAPHDRDRRREGGQPRRDDRQRPHLQAGPPAKSGIDPDSPFAKLSSLKAAMEKRTPE